MRLQLGARQYPAERSGEPTSSHAPAVVQRPGHRHGAATGRGQRDLGGRGSGSVSPAKLYARARGFAFDGEAAEVMQSEGTRVTVQDTPVADAWPGRFPGPRLSPDVADLNTRAGGSRSVSLPNGPAGGYDETRTRPHPFANRHDSRRHRGHSSSAMGCSLAQPAGTGSRPMDLVRQ